MFSEIILEDARLPTTIDAEYSDKRKLCGSPVRFNAREKRIAVVRDRGAGLGLIGGSVIARVAS